jgi:energy-coupling factor transporter ATP-binding protein EcfA2
MFQEPALFPWLTAARNVELALRARGVPGGSSAAPGPQELLDTVHLGGFGGKRPHELSGGMRQRVALARALAQDADVLLMDEPFGALDAMTRDLLHDELERICAERTLTVLFVTHNVREAARLGDRVVVLSSRPGRVIEEYAVPRARPRRIDSADVAELAGTITDRLRQEMSRHGTDAVGRGSGLDNAGAGLARAGGAQSAPGAAAALGGPVAEAARDRHRAGHLGAVHLTGWKQLRAQGPHGGVRTSGDRCRPGCCGSDRDHAAPRADRLRARAGDRLGGRRPGGADPAAAGGGRLDHHRPADDAVDRLVPVRDHPLRLRREAILFVVVLGAAPSIANGLIAGVDYTPPLLLRAGKTMGLRGFRCTGT